MSKKGSAEQTIKTIRKKTRRQHTAEEKIRIVLEGLRGACGSDQSGSSTVTEY